MTNIIIDYLLSFLIDYDIKKVYMMLPLHDHHLGGRRVSFRQVAPLEDITGVKRPVT